MALHRDEEREGIEVAEAAEREHRFREDVPEYHGYSDAEQYLAEAAAADTHSSDVDPGADR